MSEITGKDKNNHTDQTEQIVNISECMASYLSQSSQQDQIASVEEHQKHADIPAQLFVYSISKNTTEEQLKQHFSQSGSVISVFVPQSKAQNRKFGFITMKNKEQAENAKNILDWTELNLYKIQMWIIENNSELITSENCQISSIEQIFESTQLTEEEKSSALNQLMKDNIYNLLLQFNSETFTSINSKLNDLSTQSEISLLNTIEFISKLNSQSLKLQDNQIDILRAFFFKAMKQSGLIQKIESLIQNRIDQKENNKISSFSSINQQLIIIYFHLMNKFQININIMSISTQFVSDDIQLLIQLIKNNNQSNNNNNDQQIKIKIEQIEETLRILDKLILIYKQQQLQIDDSSICISISPLIHFNCPSEIKCHFNMNVKMNPSLYNFQSHLYYIISNLIINNNIKQQLINVHNILPHLTIPIISFASQYSLPLVQNNNKQQISIYSQYQIQLFLQLLYKLISSDIENHLSIASIQNLISSLIKLMCYKINDHNINDQQFEVIQDIRIYCVYLLRVIQQYFDESTIIHVCNEGYIKAVTSVLVANIEYGQDNDNEVYKILWNFKEFLIDIQKGKKQLQQQQIIHSFPSQYALIKQSIEQIEEEGCLEELESLLINKGSSKFLKYFSIQTKNIITNFYVDLSNIKPY